MANFSNTVGVQIRHLVTSVSKKTLNATAAELASVTQQYGSEARVFLLRCLVNQIELRPKVQTKENQARLNLLTQELAQISLRPNFSSLICLAFEGVDSIQTDFVIQLSKLLKLSLSQQMTIAIGLGSSVDPAVKKEGLSFVKAHLRELAESKDKPPLFVAHNLFFLIRSNSSLFVDVGTAVESLRQFYAVEADALVAPLFPVESSVASARHQSDPRALVSMFATATDIAELLHDLGPSSPFREVFEQFPNLKEQDIARIVGMIARTQGYYADSGADIWNVDAFVQIVAEMFPHVAWSRVIFGLDHPGFFVSDPRGFATLLDMYRKATREPFPLEAVLRQWTNIRGQISFLRYAVTAPPEIFCFVPPQRGSNWASLDLLELLLNLSASEHYAAIRNIFEYPMKHCPDLLITGIASLKSSTWNSLAQELAVLLMPLYIANYPASAQVIVRLWHVNQNFVVRALVNAHALDPNSLPRLLDIAQDLKALMQVLESRPFAFTIDLASLAGRREYLNLDKWLQEHIQEYKDAFVRACIAFLREKILGLREGEMARTGRSIQLPVEVMLVFFKCLLNNQFVSKEVQDDVKTLHAACIKQVPQLDTVAESNTSGETFTPEIESEANTHFQQLFTGSLGIAELVEKLKLFMVSNVPREQKVYSCIIRNLFDECRFFHKYPDKELRISGTLFGCLIQHQLITALWLGIALRYVLDSLKKQVNTKMFKFGLYALEQFRSRLPEWPQYCSHIDKLDHLRQVPSGAEILDQIRQILQDRAQGASAPVPQEVAVPAHMPVQTDERRSNLPGLPVAPAVAAIVAPAPLRTPDRKLDLTATGFAPTLNIDTLLQAPAYTDGPDDAVADKVYFIINNLSSTNLDQKARELKGLLSERFYSWLANYVVQRRVSMEANFHNLYLQFIDTLNSAGLNAALLVNTYENLRVLLRSEKIRSSTSERTLLKNLGSWLGLLTIAKNKPLLSKDINLKQLILEAYDHGRLIAVVPFVCKVLDACKVSKIFRPPNPWIVAILALLTELHNLTDLKMNLKFEVVALTKSLGLDVAELKPSALLIDRQVDKSDSSDWTTRDPAPILEPLRPPPGILKPDLSTPLGTQPAVVPPGPPLATATAAATNAVTSTTATATTAAAGVEYGLGSLVSQLVVPMVDLFTQYPALKRFVAVAVSTAVREIIAPVVERSVTIACITSRVLVLKDFSLEADEARLVSAAHTMVKSLSGSLALVTCKEPLRQSLSSHLKALLLQQVNVEQNPSLAQLVEVAVAQVVQDNIEVACKFVEDSATEKAVHDLDETLSQTNRMRRAHREKTGQPLYDTSGFTLGRYPSMLPEELRPIAAGLSPAQLHLYDDFAGLRKRSEAAWTAVGAAPTNSKPVTEGLSQGEAVEKLKQILDQLDLASRASTAAVLASLAAESDIRQLLSFIPALLNQCNSPVRQDCSLAVAQRLASSLFAPLSTLQIEVYTTALESLQAFVPSLPKLLADIAQSTDTERTFSRDVVAALARCQLLSNVPDEVMRRGVRVAAEEDIDPPGMLKEVLGLFQEWIRVYRGPAGQEKAYLAQLQQAGFLKGDDASGRFFRLITEFCIERCYLEQFTGATVSWENIDALSKLVLLLVKGTDATPATKVNLFNKAVGAAVRVLTRDHESKSSRLYQRPYYRLFICWLADLNTVDDMNSFQLLAGFSQAFLQLSPQRLPAFAFSWLDLISHRSFMPRLLNTSGGKGLALFQKLLVSLLQFLEPHLRSLQLNEPIVQLYKGTLRVLLVLLHDFPEFLCEYCFSFCDVIPATCVQLRNLILSAFPRTMRLPDPFTPHLKVDLLPEIKESPHISSNYQAALMSSSLRTDLDNYLRTRQPSFLQELPLRLLLPASEAQSRGTRFNAAAINALVLHVGLQAIAQVQQEASTILQPAPIEIFVTLASDLSAEGRYIFFNAVANHLRYPNSHTHYFSWVLLYLFSEPKNEIIQEQITRVLLERLIVNRPHPWGLLITFIELIKNPRYNFWQHRFVRCSPEIERLFEHVARNCVGVQPQRESAEMFDK
eukprot:TRINITY_DN9037_c0_g1_i1.p1 TRINITY_DN9037_c0_g1~~TRINITY_DN9037_c0_g1_i1.p1  ORF type:complete len:2034 (-),score=429.50 TRINITY_DN9037_c0_g1_i1:786-6887(-)